MRGNGMTSRIDGLVCTGHHQAVDADALPAVGGRPYSSARQ